jgi:hypothetical protein
MGSTLAARKERLMVVKLVKKMDISKGGKLAVRKVVDLVVTKVL